MIHLPHDGSPVVSIVVLAFREAAGLRACLSALEAELADAMPTEVIVLANGADRAVRAFLDSEVHGATLLRSDVNLGFAGGCNEAVAASRAEFVVLLNDDAVVRRGWLRHLVAAARRHPEAGAVGSKLVGRDGVIVEAGQVIWRDGTTVALGVGQPVDEDRFDFVRTVDYCSAASLLIRRSTWDAVGGMDDAYFPAYYEDVDLCLSIRALGQAILFEPRSVVVHDWGPRSTSSYPAFLIDCNRRRFREKWSRTLEEFEPTVAGSRHALERASFRARGCPTRLLMIDDRLPTAVGAGYGRMLEVVRELATKNYAISFHARERGLEDSEPLCDLGVEVVREDVLRHVQRPERLYDVVLLSRPSNAAAEIAAIRVHQPTAALVYDCEALQYRRLEGHTAFVGAAEQRVLGKAARTMRAVELAIPQDADAVVCVTGEEADIVRSFPGDCPVHVVRSVATPAPPTRRPFEERSHAVFVASWLAGSGSPNADAVCWLAEEVMPYVRLHAPWVRVRVTGANPPEELRDLESVNLRFVGHVEDLQSLYASARVALVPMRFGSGIKIKAAEALRHGVPIVSTGSGSAGLGLDPGGVLAPVDDPRDFASRLVALTTDPIAWAQAHAEVERLLADTGHAGVRWETILFDARERRAKRAFAAA